MNHKQHISLNSSVTSLEINALMHVCWDAHEECDYQNILVKSLSYATVRDGDTLIGFCNLAWDGGRHATIFDLNVHPDFRKQGLALKMLEMLKGVAKSNNVKFLHVDCSPHLEPLYKKAGFEMISAGLICL